MKLALKRGLSHEEFLRTTSAHEVSEYIALDLIDPIFEGQRIDSAAATVANLTYNLGRHPESDPTTVSEWLPDYSAWLTNPQKTVEEQSDEFDQWYEEQKRKGIIEDK